MALQQHLDFLKEDNLDSGLDKIKNLVDTNDEEPESNKKPNDNIPFGDKNIMKNYLNLVMNKRGSDGKPTFHNGDQQAATELNSEKTPIMSVFNPNVGPKDNGSPKEKVANEKKSRNQKKNSSDSLVDLQANINGANPKEAKKRGRKSKKDKLESDTMEGAFVEGISRSKTFVLIFTWDRHNF